MQESLDLKISEFKISRWEDLIDLPNSEHDEKYLKIIEKHDFSKITIPIPLKSRYTKGRKWTEEEFEACFSAWLTGTSLTLIAANLNRNPQDMIYKLLDRCKEKSLTFTQRGRAESTTNWNEQVKLCSEELFENGLPAWKIAVIFKIDFEYLEKELFVKRKGYGHSKKNPFSINTDHKQFANYSVIENIDADKLSVLEAYAGEGRFTKILIESNKINEITCIEKDEETFSTLIKNIKSKKVCFYNTDNLSFFATSNKKYDIVDLDPFVSCHQQLDNVWNFLLDESYLFLTFGGEYRRSFIKTNRKSIYQRYEFYDETSSNSDYLEKIPYYFLGFVAKKAYENNFEFEVIRSVRYANNCRFWLKIRKTQKPCNWFTSHVYQNIYGYFYRNLYIPRFKEIRKEIDNAKKTGFNR